jgi:hypothetical protein
MENPMAVARKTKRPARTVVERGDEQSPWESGELGRSEEHVIVAAPEVEAALDEALGLQPISVRLQQSLIKDLKLIARYHGIGYQPLLRDALNRFARFELREMAETVQKVESARSQIVRHVGAGKASLRQKGMKGMR